MKTRKNLFLVLSEWWKLCQTNLPIMPKQSSSYGVLLRWLVPNGGTIILLLLFVFAQSVGAIPLLSEKSASNWTASPTINYQGRLADSAGVPIDDTVAMQFSLYDSDTGGISLWGPETHATVPVSEGLFSVALGSQTSGGIPNSVLSGDVWLEITVDGETLSPREQLRAVPYAIQSSVALTVPDGSIGTNQIADSAVTQDKAPSLIAGQSDNQQIRVGQPVITTDANGEAWISLGTPFPTDIYNFVAINGDYGADGGLGFTVHRARGGQDRTGFTVQLVRDDGTALANKTVRVYYIAIGN